MSNYHEIVIICDSGKTYNDHENVALIAHWLYENHGSSALNIVDPGDVVWIYRGFAAHLRTNELVDFCKSLKRWSCCFALLTENNQGELMMHMGNVSRTFKGMI